MSGCRRSNRGQRRGDRADEHRHDRLPLSARSVQTGFGQQRRGVPTVQAGRWQGRPGGRSPCGTTYDDYYVVRANALEDNVRLYRVVKGRGTQIDGVNTKVAGDQWHSGLRAEGDRFTVSFDGKTLFTARDNTFANSGKVALWTKADSVTHFDTITIQPLP